MENSHVPTFQPKHISKGESTLAFHLNQRGIKFEREFRPDTVRRWKLDFAFPAFKIGVEVHGAVWVRGRHSRGGGQEKDFEKSNWLVLNGWRILTYTTQMVVSGIALADIQAILGSTEPV